jgi:riboflavin-specific deaminase-like protein
MTDLPRSRITLTWAQSLDGCIALKAGEPYRISGPESSLMTQRLRASHDAILVGIGTVLADDPRLDVRRVEGPSPRPLILDSDLRLPPGSRLVRREDRKPWVFAAEGANAERRAVLERLGCRVFETPRSSADRLDLAAVAARLAGLGVGSVLVEGGARVLASFIAARLADRIVITIGPLLLGGYNPFSDSEACVDRLPLCIADPVWEVHGFDIVMSGLPDWQEKGRGSG